MGKTEYDRVVKEMRLIDDTFWPIPVVLDISERTKQKINNSNISELALCDQEGTILAYLEISEIWTPNKETEAQYVYATTSRNHPGVDYLFRKMGDYYVGGKIVKVADPKYYDFPKLRKKAEDLKTLFKEKGYEKIVAFQTQNLMHRSQVELTMRLAQTIGAHLLLHPIISRSRPEDVEYFSRVKCYQHLIQYYPEGAVTLSLFSIVMRMAGPREALWHAIIHKNYGCTHIILGGDYAKPDVDDSGTDFYPSYLTQELIKSYEKEIGIHLIPIQEVDYPLQRNDDQAIDKIVAQMAVLNISDTKLKKMLKKDLDLPEGFTYPEIIEELKNLIPSRQQQGIVFFFTGLSASGKSTLANALTVRLMETQDRRVTLLDGDIIRTHLSSELGFSKEHRSLNVRRVGFVASEIAKNKGIGVCALIAPYAEDRLYNRRLINDNGNYIEIYVNTPLLECEKRDPKGLYSLARQGKLNGFTGIDDPYEEPQNPEIIIDTTAQSVDESVDQIINYLKMEGYIR